MSLDLARFRPVALLGRARQLCPGVSDLDFLGDFEGVVDLNPKISHRTFNFRMSEQELNSSKVASAAVDQCRLGPAHRMRGVLQWVEANAPDPLRH